MTIPASTPAAPARNTKTIVEVHPDVFQIVGRDRSAHAYLILGTYKNALIDCGLPDAFAHVSACLAEIGLTPADIDIVLLTHEHIDHSGCAPLFGRQAMVAAHRLAANKLLMNDEFVVMNQAFGSASRAFHLDLLLVHDSSIHLGNFELQVIHTPGHCSGAVCFYEPRQRLLFSGDAVMADGYVGGVLQSGSVSDYIGSLKRLSTLRIDKLFPGHGKYSNQAQADIIKGVERLETLLKDSKMLFQAVQNSQHEFDQILGSLRHLNR